MSFTLLQPFKESLPLFRFEFGTSVVTATTAKSPVIWKGETYKPEPAIECEFPRQGGGLSEEAARIELPTLRSSVNPELASMAIQMSKPRSVPRTQLSVINLLKNGNDFKPLYLYEGRLVRVVRNPDGKASLVRLEFESELSTGLKDITLGRRCDPECDFIFASNGCGLSRSQYWTLSDGPPAQSLSYVNKIRRTKVVMIPAAQANSREVELRFDLTAPEHSTLVGTPDNQIQLYIRAQSPGWWLRSFLEKDGLRITIQQWKTGSGLFVLNRIPPESWANSRLELVPDCAKSLYDCQLRQNTANFGGMGIGIPAYNPTLEIRG
jgi:hypothetical protein